MNTVLEILNKTTAFFSAQRHSGSALGCPIYFSARAQNETDGPLFEF